MATDKSFADYILDQLSSLDSFTCKKMFGEYGFYYNGKIVASACDNRFLVKITIGGKEYIKNPKEGFCYPGAKPSFLIDEKLEDKEWLSELIRITERELPMPKPKKKKK